jgi:hypothetical protein
MHFACEMPFPEQPCSVGWRPCFGSWELDRGVGPFEPHRGAHPLPVVQAATPVITVLPALGAVGGVHVEGGGRPLRPDDCEQTLSSLEDRRRGMRIDEQVTVWRTHVGGGSSCGGATWWRQLRQWWAGRQATRQRAAVAACAALWNPQRETVQPLPGGTAADVAAAQGRLSTATRLHEFSL